MRILVALTYYSPHISGVTVYARRLARRLVESGHEVTVLTSHFGKELPRRELIDGATIVRSPVLALLSKGALMPFFVLQAAGLMRGSDAVHIHLPQFESSALALIAKLLRKPVVITYHCDIELPPGVARSLFTPLIRLTHFLAGMMADRIVVNTEEYGQSARLPRHFHQKVVSMYPPIELAPPACDAPTFRRKNSLGDGPLVGFVGRFAEEKGIGDLVDAVPGVLRDVPGARFALAGLTDTVPGERVHEKLGPKIAALGASIVHLGPLSDEELAAFYHAMDVLVLPSTNSTESFGMTQAEAMTSGTPVIASDISGVREPITITGMGRLVPPHDPTALSQAIVEVLRSPERFLRAAEDVHRLFNPERTARFYEQLFAELLGSAEQTHGQSAVDPSEEPATRGKPAQR